MLSNSFPVAILSWHRLNLLVNTCSAIKKKIKKEEKPFSWIIMLFIEALSNLIHSSDSCRQRHQNRRPLFRWCLACSDRHENEWTVLYVRWDVMLKMPSIGQPLYSYSIHFACMLSEDSFPSSQAVRIAPFHFLKSVISGLLITVCSINWSKQWVLKQSDSWGALIQNPLWAFRYEQTGVL